MIIEIIWALLGIIICLCIYFSCRIKTITTNTNANDIHTHPAEGHFRLEEDSLPPYTPPTPKTRAVMAASIAMTDLPPSYQETMGITTTNLRILMPMNIVTHNAHSLNSFVASTSDHDGGSSSQRASSSNIRNDGNANTNANTNINNNHDGKRPTSNVVYSSTMSDSDIISIPATHITHDIYSIPY